jgi:hypothetical protein
MAGGTGSTVNFPPACLPISFALLLDNAGYEENKENQKCPAFHDGNSSGIILFKPVENSNPKRASDPMMPLAGMLS